jgi:hypothetical protein
MPRMLFIYNELEFREDLFVSFILDYFQLEYL